jgi:CDP-diglyceride synthetase
MAASAVLTAETAPVKEIFVKDEKVFAPEVKPKLAVRPVVVGNFRTAFVGKFVSPIATKMVPESPLMLMPVIFVVALLAWT